MNLIDPLCITAVGALAGALARRFAPRVTPRYRAQAVALGAVGAWGGVLLAAWLVASGAGPGAGAGAGAGTVVVGATAWVCALLGAVIVLDGYHLVRRRQVCWPADGLRRSLLSRRGQGGLAYSPQAPYLQQPRHLVQTGAEPIYRSGPALEASNSAARLAAMRFGAALGVGQEAQRHPGEPTGTVQPIRSAKEANRASSFALERKLARKRRLQLARSGSRTRTQTGPGRRPT